MKCEFDRSSVWKYMQHQTTTDSINLIMSARIYLHENIPTLVISAYFHPGRVNIGLMLIESPFLTLINVSIWTHYVFWVLFGYDWHQWLWIIYSITDITTMINYVKFQKYGYMWYLFVGFILLVYVCVVWICVCYQCRNRRN